MPRSKKQTAPCYQYSPGMDWNAVEKVIMERRSIRAFKDEPLPENIIRRILEAGRFAPSAGNCQPWKFVVITDPEVLAELERDTVRLSKLAMWFMDYERSPLRQKILAPLVKIAARIQPGMLHPIPFNLLKRIAADATPVYHKAPAMILIMVDRRGVGSPLLDAGICGQNMVLAAHSLGVGTCWIGMLTLAMKLPKWRRRLGLKYPYTLDDCLVLGWPKGNYDGEVDREIQLVEWITPGGTRRTERQGG